MSKWEQLIAAREREHLSQLEAAERVNVGLVTYQRWEAGKAKPQPQHLRHLYEVFGPRLDRTRPFHEHRELCEEQVAVHASHVAASVATSPEQLPSEACDEAEAFIAANMTTHLWFLAFLTHATCNEKRSAIRQAIEESDAMNSSDKNYQMTRREALCALAALPMITFGLGSPGRTVASPQYGSLLAQCAASVEACWELSKSDEANDLALAFQSVSKCLSALKTIVRDSTHYRKEAADLAARYAILKTILGWHCRGLSETIEYAKEAVAYSRETGDLSLQLSAYSKLSWAYLYNKQYVLALQAAQEAQFLFEQDPKGVAVPTGIRGGTYSTLALMQVKNGFSADTALGKATEMDPGNECHAFLEFTRADLPLEVGYTYCYQGNQTKAMAFLETIVDPITLTIKEPTSERGRLDAIRMMALSTLRSKERDMEKSVFFWTAAMESARALQSEWGFNEALTIYELMEVVWPEEPRIADLRSLIVHW